MFAPHNLGSPGADAARASNTRSVIANDGLSEVLHRLGPLAVSVTSQAEAVQASIDIGRLLGFSVSRTGETLEWSVEALGQDHLSLELLAHNLATAAELARIAADLKVVLSELGWRTAKWLPTSLVELAVERGFVRHELSTADLQLRLATAHSSVEEVGQGAG